MKKLTSKKCIALILAVVMIITSVPLMMAGAIGEGTYDPAPYFSDEAIKQGADAWVDDAGNIQVEFPAATPVKTFKGEDTSIAFYILELIDMGPKDNVHQQNVLKTIKATGTSATFKAADIGTFDFENKRYSVTITAVDSENWFSQPIYTTVTSIPAVKLDPEKFHYFSTSDTAVREIMTFEKGTDDGVVSGAQLLYMGAAAETGTEDLSDNIGDTSALRFIINDKPTGTQNFDTSYSRQTWDFNGAEEVWYWMDLTDVELKGVSFRLRTNEKLWVEWKDATIATTQRAGETVYSTKGTAASTYTGADPYVYVQREDGGWDKVMLNDNGTVDLGNFTGYVRVPLEFMCSETATYVDISNQEFGTKKSFTSGANNTVNESNAFSWMAGMTFSQKVLVDNPGTPISDALLIHRRAYKTSSGFLNLGTKHTFTWNINGQTHYTEDLSSFDYSKIGYMLAMPLDEDSAKTSVTTGNASTDRAYVSGTTVMNREAGLKAIEDIYNAGFSIEGCSDDSLQNSFYIDNIFFYRTDGGAYSENSLDGAANTGDNITTYYNEQLEISRLIFDEVDKYIEEPDWADYREIEYILALVEAYRQAFAAKGKSTDFLDLSKVDGDNNDDPVGVGLAWAAEQLGRDSWATAWEAYEACLAAGTLNSANADRSELVPVIVRAMEKLPAPESITTVSDSLRIEIIKIWKAYALLNFGQLEALGKKEEERILKYIALLDSTDDDEFIVGQQLANYPFITYNDFENMTLGAQAWQIADNKNAYSTGFTSANGVPAGTHNPDGQVYTMAEGWRHTKGFTTYTINGKDNIDITKEGQFGYSPTDGDFSQEVMDNKLHYDAAYAEITDNGYLNTHAATMDIDSSFTADNQNGAYHTVTFARHGKDSANWTEFQTNTTGLDGLGMMSTQNSNGNESIGLSLIMYVDFTELSNFYFTTNIYTKDENGTPIKARPNMGIALNDDAKINNWKYFILDPVTGEWVINHTTSQWCFTSTMTDASWGDTLSLDGYKGYIMIPLYHIKVQNSIINEAKLDGNSIWLNNIYAIQFCIGGKNADSLDEKTFTIDNIGFTYDPVGYTNTSVSHPSYAEVFDAKSLPAKQFEDAVKAIDPYDASTIKARYDEALAKYNALVPFQQDKVATAKAILDSYVGYANDTSTIPAPLYDPAQLTDFVNALPEAIRTTGVTGETDIPYPGFTNGIVNYASMGIDKTTAEEIIKHYNESYSRFTVNQKDTVLDPTVKAQFLNAYNMAMRMTQTLESIRTEVIVGEGEEKPSFLSEITGLYTAKYDYNNDGILDDIDNSVADSTPYKIGNFVSIEGRQFVEDFKDNKYEPLQFYSKTLMEDGSIYSQLQNTSRGFTYFLKNTETYNIDGEEIKGGILTFRDKLQTVYNIASDHIANGVRFSADELSYVKDILAEYNALLPAYYNVEELYELEQKIIRLFSVSNVAVMDSATDGVSLTEVSLNNNDEASMKKTVYVDLTYIAALLDTTVTLQAVSDLKLTQISGTTFADLNSFTVDGFIADKVVDMGEYDNLYPDEVFTRIPLQIAVDPDIAMNVPKDAVYEGSITFNVYETADIEAGLIGEDLVPIATLELPVTFTGTLAIAYEVTIPAIVQVEWDTREMVDVSYSVKASLASNELSVSVSNDGTDMLINDDTGTTYELAYSKANFDTETFTGDVAEGTKPTNAPSITVTGWDNVPVGKYSTQLTYTVDVTS
ncbi:MAG: hypothetical protein IIV47_01070 [Clostridia bacterium]|nr:hypothetical protein [Clostridia bacterium]